VTETGRSLWLQEAMASGFEPAPPLEGRQRADVCIVGGGYTGLWAALRLKELEPSLDVAVVEADVCGGGASGRNGGFVLSWWAKFATLLKLCGVEEALRLGHAAADAVTAIGAFCEANGIDANYRHDGWMWAAVNRAQMGSWRATVEALDAQGVHPFEELSPEDAARRAGSPVHIGGVFERSGATVQPALLAFGLRRVALDRGVRIYERSPMVALDAGSPATVRTSIGALAADRVILAMNSWLIRFRQIRRRVLVIGSDIVATEPIPEHLREIGWQDGMAISDSRLLVHYYRTTLDRRIAFGKGGGSLAFGARLGAAFEGPSSRAGVTERAFRFTYPSLADVRISSGWTGPIDRSRTGLPFFAQLDGHPNVVYGVGYSGNGVGPSYLGGRILASLALQREDEWASCGLVGTKPGVGGFPPEPFRFVGGHLVRSAIERTERAEDEGRRPGAIASRLVRLAPAGLVPARR
jgi:putative aminophosphonate oxidoreductase